MRLVNEVTLRFCRVQLTTQRGKNHRGPIFRAIMTMNGCKRMYVMKNDKLIRLSYVNSVQAWMSVPLTCIRIL
jgi:hypothetical protein